MSASADVGTREGCLRCAPAPGRIHGLVGDSVATCRSCGLEWLRLPLFESRYFTPSLRFNEWLHENAGTTTPPMAVLDTTTLSPAQTATAIAEWVRAGLER